MSAHDEGTMMFPTVTVSQGETISSSDMSGALSLMMVYGRPCVWSDVPDGTYALVDADLLTRDNIAEAIFMATIPLLDRPRPEGVV